MTTSTILFGQMALRSASGKQTSLLLILLFLTCSLGCSSGNQMASGSTKKLTVAVGSIQEISLPGSGDGSTELIGTSDNQEIVDVSRQQLAPAVDTLKRTESGSTVFQIKGITAGKANVVFSKKKLGESGNGQPVRTYVVQVTAK